VSIRSKGRLPINGLAIKFGGGGHLYAAGATLSLPLEQVKEQILSERDSF
jgi:nanoRNase/pAp phosphatase (c-di-AMP/oligoRNAs hydrolase)